MALYISSLNSGSNGNSYYIGNEEDAVLVDAGISCREMEKRMQRSGLLLSKVRAVFISHEHSDHIRGVEVFSRKHQIPVYITEKTLAGSRMQLDSHLIHHFCTNAPTEIGNLKVHAFSKQHDAADPHSFTIEYSDIKIAVLTDIGVVCENVASNFSNCDAAFLETNYCEQMLSEGNYPYYLKQRISSNKGHLSNRQALELFTRYKSEKLKHVLLSHLSKDNNSPETALELFQQRAGNTIVSIAPRYTESDVYRIVANSSVIEKLNQQINLF
jgi:phosphoribosyl 1,2-cyclic phosphodiesterase